MVIVRPARSEETEAIHDLLVASIRAFGPDAYDEREVEAWAYTDEVPTYPVDHSDHAVLVAEDDGTLAGYGDVAPPEEELFAVYVHPEYAGEGVGTTLLERLESVAHERDCERLELTASRNAVGFYEQAGYDRIEVVDHEPTGPHDVTLECVRMAKSLQ